MWWWATYNTDARTCVYNCIVYGQVWRRLSNYCYKERLRLNYPKATHSNVGQSAVFISSVQDPAEEASSRSPNLCSPLKRKLLWRGHPAFSDLLNSTIVEKKVATRKGCVLNSTECLKAEKFCEVEEKEQRKFDRIEKISKEKNLKRNKRKKLPSKKKERKKRRVTLQPVCSQASFP